MLVRPPKTNFKMTVRVDCAVSTRSPLRLSIKALAPDCGGRGQLTFGQVSPPHQLLASKIKKLSFPQRCLFIGF